MKRTFSIIIIVCWVFAACQATPEEEIVIKKDFDVEEVIEVQETEEITLYTAPESWNETVDIKDDKLSVKIDAEIKIPSSGMLPIAKIETIDIADEMAEKIIDVLFDGQKIYKSFGKKTKSEIEQEILEEKAKFTDPDSVINQQTDPDMKEIKRKGVQEKIDLLTNQFQKAPEESELVETNGFVLTDETKDNTYYILEGWPLTEEGKQSFIRIWKDEKNYINNVLFMNKDSTADLNMHRNDYFNMNTDDPKNIENLRGITISLEDAKKIVDKMISDIGANDMVLSDIGSKTMLNIKYTYYYECPQCYMFHYTRKVNDARVTYDDTIKTSDNYAMPWSYENITVCVDDTGIIGFEWNSPSSVTEILSDSVRLIEFNEIIEIFKNQISIRNVFDFAEFGANPKNKNIVIDEITLGLMRVAQKDKPDEFLLIPVWDFFGYTELSYEKSSDSPYKTDENNMHRFRNYRCSYLTINAIDGSIIDRSLGY